MTWNSVKNITFYGQMQTLRRFCRRTQFFSCDKEENKQVDACCQNPADGVGEIQDLQSVHLTENRENPYHTEGTGAKQGDHRWQEGVAKAAENTDGNIHRTAGKIKRADGDDTNAAVSNRF